MDFWFEQLEAEDVMAKAQEVIDRWKFSDETISLIWAERNDEFWGRVTLLGNRPIIELSKNILTECDSLEEVEHIVIHEMAHVRHARRTNGDSDHSQEFWDIARKEMGCKELHELNN